MSLYKNNKSGNIYKVWGKALDVTENRMADVIVYYSPDAPTKLFIRSETEFHSKFTPYEPQTPTPGS